MLPGIVHSPMEALSDSWTRLKHSRDWLYSSTCSFGESDIDFTKSVGVHTLIENVVSFVSGDVGNPPGFKEPEESMSTSPQAYIIAMEQQQQRAEVSSSSPSQEAAPSCLPRPGVAGGRQGLSASWPVQNLPVCLGRGCGSAEQLLLCMPTFRGSVLGILS